MSFRELYAELAAFIKTHDRWPNPATARHHRRSTRHAAPDDVVCLEDDAEHRLRSRVDHQLAKGRACHDRPMGDTRSGRTRVELLEELEYWPGWPERKMTWMRRYRKLEGFMRSNGRCPRPRHSWCNVEHAAEAGLEEWVLDMQSRGRAQLALEVEEVDTLVFQDRATLLEALPIAVHLPEAAPQPLPEERPIQRERKRSIDTSSDPGGGRPKVARISAQGNGFANHLELQRTQKRSTRAYINARLEALDGQTVGWALSELRYQDAKGQMRNYTLGDLRYDISAKCLEDPRGHWPIFSRADDVDASEAHADA